MADVTTTIQSEVAALAHKHVEIHARLTYALIGTLVLVLALVGFGGYLGLKAYDRQLARQEAKDAQYQQDRKTFLDTLQAHDAERTADAAKIADLEAQIKARDSKPLPPAINAGLKPSASAEQVKNALETVYGADVVAGTPKVEPDGNIALSLPQAQKAVSAAVNADKAQADLKDEKAIVSLQETTIGSLKGDLNSCKDLNTKAQADIAGYKKLAVRSKFRRFLSGAEKVALFLGGMYAGHKL